MQYCIELLRSSRHLENKLYHSVGKEVNPSFTLLDDAINHGKFHEVMQNHIAEKGKHNAENVSVTSVISDICDICERVYQSLDACGETRAIALDISKAFNKVLHAGLLHKMKLYGISGEVLNIIKSFLSGRKMKVVLDGHSSNC